MMVLFCVLCTCRRWRNSGLMPPVMESGSEGGGADDHDDEDDDDNDDDYDTADEERDGKMGAVDGRAASIGRISRNDSPVHRSPSPSSACHSLEWDSNGDDFFGHEPPPLPIHTSLPKWIRKRRVVLEGHSTKELSWIKVERLLPIKYK